MQLNGEQAQQAWGDYKGFLENMGHDFNSETNKHLQYHIQQAFKMGFASGEQAKHENSKALTITPFMEIEALPGEQIIKHKVIKRTARQLQQDARLVASILQRNGRPMYLKDITVAVNAAGANWWPKSASGHMEKVRDMYPAIKKLSRGVYEYDQ